MVADQPPTFQPAAHDSVAQPPLGGGSGAIFTQWETARSTSAEGTLLLGCVATPIPGWVEDMRPAIEARTTALMNGSAERLVGLPVEVTRAADTKEGHFTLRPAGTPEAAPRLGIARTFVGWNDGTVATCFAICASRKEDEPSARRCDASVLGARLEGSVGPPPPGMVLGAVTWAVHNPSQTAAWAAAGALVLGVVAIASRRRPRSRI